MVVSGGRDSAGGWTLFDSCPVDADCNCTDGVSDDTLVPRTDTLSVNG